MTPEASSGINSPRDFFRACGRHKGKVTLFLLATSVVTAAVILWFPRSYKSEAQLFIQVGRESVSLDPSATTGQTIQMMESREREINSAVAMLASRVMTEKVVDQLGAEVILGKDKPQIAQQTASMFGTVVDAAGDFAANVDPVDDREKAIIKIQKNLEIESPRSTSVIRVSYFDKSPKQAQEVVTALLAAHMEEHVRINRTAGSQEFFQDQSAVMEKAWQDASEILRSTKNDLGLVSIGVQSKLLEQEIGKMEGQYVESSTALAAANARVKELESLFESTPARMVIEEENGFANEALDRMHEVLYNLRVREKEMMTKFTDQHPEVIAIREQVKQASAILDEQDERRAHSTTAPNPAREKLDLDLIGAKADASALAASVSKLTEELTRIREKVELLNNNQVLVANLERDVEIAHRNYLAHAEKLEHARIDNALDNDRISNVNVIQPASYETKPATPKKGLVAGAGLAFAVLGSLVIVLIGEQSRVSPQPTAEIQPPAETPTVASSPRGNGHVNGRNGTNGTTGPQVAASSS